MASTHILVVNGREVRQPVFVLGVPWSGTEMIARALKWSSGFHVTIGQPSAVRVVSTFARRPSIWHGRGIAAAGALRDSFAQAWQVSPRGCLTCSPACRLAGGVDTSGSCVIPRTIARYGDATPDLLYITEVLIEAFPDARLIQVIRDGRDVVTGLLADSAMLRGLRSGAAHLEQEYPNPFLGVENESDRAWWPELSDAGKCAMKWRGAVRMAARLRYTFAPRQLTTLRYEDLVSEPDATAHSLSEFIGARISAIALREPVTNRALRPGAWRRGLSAEQASEVEKVAGHELRRIGYSDLT